ncbi:hypothetical protein [Tardiphaga sp.]|uniref:hypothetical protein n=1 Tax=Tardiphaga sp. TaxID=1926292 RepID=UPI0026306658|nr:hypothetical protein [Tardiphaga sp.]MDB5620052.1 hypothetical protein [Tardiphaga sp.]
MSQKTPKEDLRQRSDGKPYKGTGEPWKQPAHNVQDPVAPDMPKPDLEKWEETSSH